MTSTQQRDKQPDGAERRAGRILPDRETIRNQAQLPRKHIIKMAWRNIRMRLGRSALVASGIVLALAFLSYTLFSDAIAESMIAVSPPHVIRELQANGLLLQADDPDARVAARWMVGLAMLVCLVGVLNAMLLSVAERFGEIGTMKCLGAMDMLILKLFLLESFVQGLVGTLLGTAAGMGLALLESRVSYGALVWGAVDLRTAAGIAGASLIAGMLLTVAGALYPAWRASKMRPIEAMRVEV